MELLSVKKIGNRIGEEMNAIKYKDIFETDFLAKFGDKKKEIENLTIEHDYVIDVDQIIKCLGLTEKNTVMFGLSGQYDSHVHKILVNTLEPETRQRFTKAHELGHAVLGHKGNEKGISNRNELSSIGIDKREKEANNFAATLLMPRKLVIKVMKLYKESNDIKNWQDINVNNLIEFMARQMEVSEMSMKYRLINLGFIVY